MILKIATVSVATAMAFCCLQQSASAALAVAVTADASQGIDDLCAQVDVTGIVAETVGHCEPAPVPTRELSQGVGLHDVLWVDVLIRA